MDIGRLVGTNIIDPGASDVVWPNTINISGVAVSCWDFNGGLKKPSPLHGLETEIFRHNAGENTCELWRNEAWQDIPGYEDSPLIIYQCPGEWRSLGNRLKKYFQAIALAWFYGVNFIADMGFLKSDIRLGQISFLQYLPCYIDVHQEGGLFEGMLTMVSHDNIDLCDKANENNLPKMWTWEYIGNPIRLIWRSALKADFSERNIPIPLVDVSIQHRCGDILARPYSEYGFLTYNAYSQLLPISWGQRDIVIEATPLKKGEAHFSSDTKFIDDCGELIGDLVAFLTELGHNVRVEVGVDRSLSLARMTFSKLLICASSTFCLWPALAADNSWFPTGHLTSVKNLPISIGWHEISPTEFLSVQSIFKMGPNRTVDDIISYLRKH